ncbi:hypothetical protein T440DRAFT_462957 [Plenodomus tracheiphilus IPT5]|uniref:Heterokaryon incompatibility domain-containing protein n=1 Tax=Plenodomus tracheiphilus IPT5 TaxID=1408161 RepID=A0A6A7BNI5_9PLEO|nr:hypothetical protein T440DRAFT_462957 [Plenodomus tracheiphilus IPT5]
MPSQSRVLHIRGRIIGKIESNRLEINHLVAHGMELNATGLPVAAKVDTITPFTRRRRWWIFKKEYENGELFHQALADLPATSHLWKCHLELFLMEFEKIYRTCTMPLETRLAKDQSACRVLTGAQFQGLEPFFSLLEYLLMSRTICSMEDSRLLVAPDVAHAGDSVAVLAGCTNAVVLRRNENNESFRLLGDAHVCGVTDEETSRDGLMVISIN